MISIRKKLGAGFIISTLITVGFIIVLVNIAIKKEFNIYMNEVQNKKCNSIVDYFKEIYINDGEFTKDSGNELIHEAVMNNYCIILMDSERNVIWGMNPEELGENLSFNSIHTEERGVYTSKFFEIEVENNIVGYVEIGQYSPIILTQEDVNFILAINKGIMVSTVIVIIIGVGISIFLAKQFSKPIIEVTRMSTKLSEGNFGIKAEKRTKIKEIDNLRKNMNILADKLQSQEVLRRQLVSDISHEIRTPLNILQNNLEAMIDGIFPVTTGRLEKLNDEVIRFGKLLENLDGLKGIETEDNELNVSYIDLSEMILEIYNEFKIEAKNKNILLTCSVEKSDNYIFSGDRNKLRQVFINIINNAIKFTEENGEVNIYLKKKKRKIVFIVRDSGIGISEEDLQYIFERLYRADKSRNAIEGNGIGLAIVKSILQSHNAKIEVQSKIGLGSTFKITF